MKLLEWREEYATGMPGVDHEHRELIEMINELHARMGDDAGRDEIEGFLGEVHALIASHFALEEAEMRDRHYPRYREHKADHERLLDEILDIMDDARKRDFDADRLGRRIADWFAIHFQSHDARLHKELEKN